YNSLILNNNISIFQPATNPAPQNQTKNLVQVVKFDRKGPFCVQGRARNVPKAFSHAWRRAIQRRTRPEKSMSSLPESPFPIDRRTE
ncbi:MAG: hypothetical protein WA950_23090, partial [Shinella sp.]|uniref:hypothetical protein n=1 Tax=Shinella sp. TaxID=1870904 RepID=UPI003C767E37